MRRRGEADLVTLQPEEPSGHGEARLRLELPHKELAERAGPTKKLSEVVRGYLEKRPRPK